MLIRIIVVAAIGCLALSDIGAQTTLPVPSGPYPTIQSAISAAVTGDVVLVAPGTYFENINFFFSIITVRSQAGAAATIIDGAMSGPVVTFNSSAGDSTLDGFTLQHGFGGGIECRKSPTIMNCVIANNVGASGFCSGGGGGLNCELGPGTQPAPCVINCMFTGNVGGCATDPVAGNGGGGAINFKGVVGKVTNCTISNNVGGDAAGLPGAGGINLLLFNAVDIDNTIVWQNQAGVGAPVTAANEIGGNALAGTTVCNSDVLGGYPGTNNLDTDPLLVDLAGGDLHLQAGSPCIDAGLAAMAVVLPATDIDGDARVLGGDVDMGADETATYHGSGQDMVLSTGVNAPAAATPDVKQATLGDTLIVHFESPLGSYDFTVPVLLAQLFVTGSPPASPIGFPEVHFDPSGVFPYSVVALYDGNSVPFPPGVLPPGGMTFGYTVPAVAGNSIMIQAFALAPNPASPFLTATHGHEIRVL